jgi:hypothetical protein
MLLQRLADDVGDLPARVQARVRILKNHLHAPAQRERLTRAEGRRGVGAIELDAALGRRVEPDQQPRDRALAAA